MKYSILTLIFFSLSNMQLFSQQVASGVWHWDNLEIEKKETGERRPILEGSTTLLEYFEMHATILEPGHAPHPAHIHLDEEELVIIRQGQLKVTITGKSQILGPGSIALIMPGDKHGFENAGDTDAIYYVLKFRSKNPMNPERGKTEGGSFMVNWNDLPFQPHDKGGIRRYFDRGTAAFENFEMHVTTLNEGIKSHEPHTHRAEEIILMIKSEAEEQIDEEFFRFSEGDLVFLDSEVPHAIQNTGKGQCVYFAFQWR